MAQIPRAVWMKQSMEAAMKLLDAQTRLATAEVDVEAAKNEMRRLTGQSHSIDLSSSSYIHHYECESEDKFAVCDDALQEKGEPHQPRKRCPNIVEVYNDDQPSKRVCADCRRELDVLEKRINPPKPKEEAKPVAPKVETEIPF